MFEKDRVSGGKISSILEESWKYYKNNKIFKMSIDDLRKIHKSLLNYQDETIFGEISESVYVEYKNIENDSNDKMILSLFEKAIGIDKNIGTNEIFDDSGFLMHDRMGAAAFGRFNYIYRCKGERIYWFESGNIGVYNIYATIDENGFQYSCNDMSSINIWSDIPDGKSESEWMDLGLDYDLSNMFTILRGLVNIKRKYKRDYPLEYLIDPPDVNYISKFSTMLRSDLWDIVIQLAKNAISSSDNTYVEAFKYMIEIMDKLAINPNPRHIVYFYDSYLDNINSNKRAFNQINDIFKSLNENEDESFLDSLIYVCQKLQETNIYKKANENDKNCFVVKLLTEKCRKFVFKDQTLRGDSSNGKSSGEIDIYVEYKDGGSYAVIEALVLEYVEKGRISEHINRVWKYDTIGLPINYILVYYHGTNFDGFFDKYFEFLRKANLNYKVIDAQIARSGYSEIKVIEMEYRRSGQILKIVHLCINMHEL